MKPVPTGAFASYAEPLLLFLRLPRVQMSISISSPGLDMLAHGNR